MLLIKILKNANSDDSQEIDDQTRATAHQINANDHAMIVRLLDIMQAGNADFTLTFHYLSHDLNKSESLDKLRALFENADDLDIWLEKWEEASY